MFTINVYKVKIFDGESTVIYEEFQEGVESIAMNLGDRLTCEIEFEDDTKAVYLERYIVMYEK